MKPRFLLPFACLLLLATTHAAATAPAPASRPNVVLIVLDDMNGFASRREFAAIKMPALDRFAARAVNFTNAVCGVTVCNPSRAAFLSGLDASTTGAYLNGADVWNKPGAVTERALSLPEFFKARGYATWGGGKTFHSPLTKERELAAFDNAPTYQGGFGPFADERHTAGGSKFKGIQPWTGPDTDFPDVINADAAVRFIGQPHEKPFFVFYGLWRPHTPFTAPKRFFDQYQLKDMVIPEGWRPDDLDDVPAEGRALTDGNDDFSRPDGTVDFDKWKRYLLAYCANSSFADWNLGRVIEAVEKSPGADNTIIIVCSDNGYHAGTKERWEKGTLWEMSDYVPLLVRLPGGAAGSSPRTVSLVDLYPTLQELCGLPPPDHALDGRSFAALLRDPAAPWDRPSLTIYGKGNASVRDERYRYIRYRDGAEELYDHATDPHEFTNLAARPEARAIIERLTPRLPRTWAPSWGGRWEVPRKGEPARQAPEYSLPPGYKPKSET
jgi:arylsulfatase A-like enzyme